MAWFTDAQILGLPAFASLSPEQIPQLVDDAGALYAQIGAVPGIADSDLRSWAEAAGIPPERYNLACQALRDAGKAVSIGSGPLAPLAPAPVPSLATLSAGDSVPTEKLLEAELRKVAKRIGVDIPKSATKAEIAEAISRA
jgi:hypothetical protein